MLGKSEPDVAVFYQQRILCNLRRIPCHGEQLRIIGQPVHLQEQLAVHLLHGAVYQVVVGTFALFEQVHDGLVDKSQLARAEHVGLQKSNHVGNSLGVGKQAGNYRFFVGDPRVFLNHCS